MFKNIQKVLNFKIFGYAGFVLVYTFFLKKVFSGQFILPQTFGFGFLHLRFYGLCLAIAVLGGYLLAKKRAGLYKINLENAENIIFWIIFSAFVGARVYHVFSEWDYYAQNPRLILAFWQGGLSIFGAIFGGAVAVWIYVKIRLGGAVFHILNWLTPPLILGQVLGRLGNLFNYEAFGYPTQLPWKLFIPENFRPMEFFFMEFFHPWFLYEQLGLVLMFVFLSKFEKNLSAKGLLESSSNYLFIYYILLYNILRFSLEFMRLDSTFLFNGYLRLNSLTSLSLVVVALVLWYKRHQAHA